MDFIYTDKRERQCFAQRSVSMGLNGMVSSSQPLATLAGYKILARGGSAVDAAVAMACTLNVVEPHMVGLAGDCFALVYKHRDKKIYGMNGSGRAPAAASTAWFRDHGYTAMPEKGVLCATVPGALKAYADLLEKHGTMALADVMKDAVFYAENGFAVTEVIAGEWGHQRAHLMADEAAAATYLPGGRAPKPGQIFRNPDLARTFRRIAEGGTGVLYGGALGEEVCRHIAKLGGLITLEDLSGHATTWVEPLFRDYRDITVCELPPNGQGLTALEMLSILEGYDLSGMGPGSPEYLHRLIEAKKIAFADRDRVITDPEFHDVPVSEILSPEYAARCRRRIRDDKASDPAPSVFAKGSDTVYVCAADREGNAVSLISSLYTHFGSGVVIPDTGLFLQSRGRSFSLDPDHPNRLMPGKRTMHTIIPGMLLKDGNFQAAFGVMGGDMQPQGHAQLLVNLVDFKMNPQEAVDAARVCHMRDREVYFEDGIPEETVQTLLDMGHQTDSMPPAVNACGGGQLIWKTEDGVYLGGSDRRKDGCAIGF